MSQFTQDFGAPAREFNLHWANRAPRDICWASVIITLPAVDQVGSNPVIDSDGDPIPGTVVVKDIFNEFDTDTGEVILKYNAEAAVRSFLGLPPIGSRTAIDLKTAKGHLVDAGLTLLPKTPTKAYVRSILEDAQVRVDRYTYTMSQDILMAHESKNVKRREAGMAPVHGGFEYEEARAFVEAYNERLKQTYKQQGLKESVAVDDDELDFNIWMKAQVMDRVGKAKLDEKVDRLKLAEELLEDPEIKLQLRNRWKIRKKGHMEATEEQLKAQVEG